MKTYLVAAVLVCVAACDSPSAPRVLEARLAETNVWSGGTTRLISPSFISLSPLPLVRIGTDTLAVSRVNDSTIAAVLPDANGAKTLSVEARGFVPLNLDLTLHGFRGSEVGPYLSGYLERVPNTVHVLGAGQTGLTEVDARTGTVVRSWPETVHSADCVSSVGPSIRAGYYVFWGKDSVGGRCTHPWVWQYVLSGLTRTDSLYGVAGAWGIAELGPGGSISGGDDALSISQCGGTGCTQQTYFNQGGGLSGVSIARSANRAFLHHYFGYIVDATTGDTLGRLPLGPGGAPATNPWYHVENIAFSPVEDTLYAVGSGGLSGSILLVAATSNGALIDSVPLPGLYAGDVVVDGVRPWVYVAVLGGNTFAGGPPQLLVFGRGTLRPIAVLRAPASEVLSPTQWHQFRLVLDPVMHAAYLVATTQVVGFRGQSKILRFDLLP